MKVLTIRVPVELYERIKKSAKRYGVTMNALVVKALWKTEE